MISRVGISSVLAMMCVATMTACGSDETPAVEPDVPRVSEILYTTVWSADSGVDLFGRGAELIRATEEAASYTYWAGPSATYPGYLGAVRNSDIDLSPDDPDFRTDGGSNSGTVHTKFRHIVDYSADSHAVSATVCDYALFEESTAPSGSMFLSGSSRVALVNSTELPGQPGVVDKDLVGHHPRAQRPPSWNVFGKWKVVEYASILSNAIPQLCTDWWQRQFPMFIAGSSGDGSLMSPPGYVVPTMPVAVQYPEWIGP